MRTVEGKMARLALRKVRQRGQDNAARIDSTVRRILRRVDLGGDAALRRYAMRLDGLTTDESLRVPPEELKHALKAVPIAFRKALDFAARNIRQFAEWQKPNEWMRELIPGVSVGQVVRPVDSVGCYIPAGRYPLPSTLLMTAIPAQVAGVSRIALVSPRATQETLAAAALLEIKEVYRIGGAQAIAALAYGTESMARVDKIVGPGNVYVASAKKLVSGRCAIDMVAGPTEALIFSERGNPAFIAADLVAQAEHDVAAVAMFVTTNRLLARAVNREVVRRAKNNPVAKRALQKGLIFLVSSRLEALEIVNEIASEHVTVDTPEDVDLIRHAGSIFVGNYSAQPIGDYCSGPNHVLPTNGTARWRGGLSVVDFLKIVTVQKLSAKGMQRIGDCAITLAEAESLRAHAEAVRLRLTNKNAIRTAYA